MIRTVEWQERLKTGNSKKREVIRVTLNRSIFKVQGQNLDNFSILSDYRIYLANHKVRQFFRNFSISSGKSYFVGRHWIPAFAGMT